MKNLNELVPVDYSNQRVLTTAQLADCYGTSPGRIRDNFKASKKHFVEGVHYFKVEGEALSELREQVMCVLKSYAHSPIPKGCRSLTLWTHEGCVRHCKMLNTQAAWDMFNELEHVYFAVKEAATQQSLFPDEEPVKEKKAVRRPLPEVAVVYIILLANGLVKIGYSSDFNRRLKEIRKETKLDIIDFFTTNFMSLDDARKLEATLKAKFFVYLVSGEFFNAPFEEIKASLQESPAEKLIALAEKIQDAEAKDKVLMQAVGLPVR